MSVHTSAGDERHWGAWAGDRDRFARLAKVMDDLIAPEREEAIRVIEAELASASYGDAEYKASRRVTAAAQWDSTLEVFEKELSIKHEGPPGAVLASIDPLTIRRATLSSPRQVGEGNRSQVDLSGEGCSLRVSGVDPKWVRMATGTIAAEIEHGVPPWHWIRSRMGDLMYGIIAGTPVFVLLLVRGDWSDETGKPLHPVFRVLVSGLVAILVGTFLGSALGALARRLLPGFEILTPEQRGRGGRVLAFIGVQALGVALAIIFFLLER